MVQKKLNRLQIVGKKIATLRHEKNMSQDELAAEALISNRTLQKLELGQTNPRFSTFEKIADYLGIDIKVLFEDL